MAKKLLIIDDEASITKVVGKIAESIGLDWRGITGSSSAAGAFIEYRPDIVLLDMMMPEKDGIDVLNEILATAIPARIVLMSGFGTSYLRLAEGVAKFHDYDMKLISTLQKPFRRAEMIDLLRGIASPQ